MSWNLEKGLLTKLASSALHVSKPSDFLANPIGWLCCKSLGQVGETEAVDPWQM
jgi:hypothetical protein